MQTIQCTSSLCETLLKCAKRIVLFRFKDSMERKPTRYTYVKYYYFLAVLTYVIWQSLD